MEVLTDIKKLNSKKILLVRLDRIGDMLVSTPIIKALREAYPDAQIDMLASSLNWQVLQYNKDINSVYSFNKRRILSFIPTWIKLIFAKYDTILCLTSSSRTSSFVVKYIPAKYKIAFSGGMNDKVYTHTAQYPDKQHVYEIFQGLAENIGLKIDKMQPILEIPQNIQEKMDTAYPKAKDVFRAVLFIGNMKKPFKHRWAEQSYAKLVEFLHDKYSASKQFEIVVMAGPGDIPLLKAFEHLPKNIYTTYIGTDIYETAAYLKSSNLLVCSSSGPTHIASAVECPILSLISRYNLKVWRPLGENDINMITKKEVQTNNEEDIRSICLEDVAENIDIYFKKWKKTISE